MADYVAGGSRAPADDELAARADRPTGELLATTDRDMAQGDVRHWTAEFAPLAWQNDRVSSQTATVRVDTSDRTLVPGGSGGGLLHPKANNKIRAWAGLLVNGSWTWVAQGTYLANRVTAASNGGVTSLDIPLVDTLRPVRSNLESAFAFDDGDLVEDTVARLLAQAFGDDNACRVAPTGFDLPAGSFSTGENRLALIDELLLGAGHELATDAYGCAFTRRIPPTSASEFVDVWEYGGEGIPVEEARREWRTGVPQGYRIKAGSLQNTDNGFEVVAWDLDPTSEGFFDGPGETTIPELTLPFVRSETQAIEAAYGQLRRHGVGPGIVEITTVPNPFIKEGDMVHLTEDGLNATGYYRVIGYSLPIQLDGLMSITLRGIYDPAGTYSETAPTVPAGPSFQVSFSDDFDRPDENLEDWPAGAGSPDWTEHGFSWAVVDREAIQRYDRNWSFAVVNTAMKNTNHRAEVVIAEIPTERYLGPMCRSSREFDGYYAKASSTGLVQLEVWLAGKRIDTLGESNVGGSLAGRTLAVQAVDRTITVEIDGETIVTADDDRRTGAYVGMLAYGGWTGNSPAVDSFTAGVSI